METGGQLRGTASLLKYGKVSALGHPSQRALHFGESAKLSNSLLFDGLEPARAVHGTHLSSGFLIQKSLWSSLYNFAV